MEIIQSTEWIKTRKNKILNIQEFSSQLEPSRAFVLLLDVIQKNPPGLGLKEREKKQEIIQNLLTRATGHHRESQNNLGRKGPLQVT